MLPLLFLVFLVIKVTDSSNGITYPVYSIDEIAYTDLALPDSSIAIRLTQILTRDGALQITNIPNFAAQKAEAFQNLPDCLAAEPNTAQMSMNDNSVRRTTAAESKLGIGGKMLSNFGETASKLRASVDLAINQLAVALDIASQARTVSNSASTKQESYLMKPYQSFTSLISSGSHLEHLHVYSPPSISSQSPSDDAVTMDFHVDSGLFVAMTNGYYDPSSYSDRDPDRGLYLELSTGQRVKAITQENALIVLIGAAASTWLEPVLGRPLRPAPHALVARLQGTEATRSWFGKMVLPPPDALLPSVTVRNQASQPQMTYETYRDLEIQGERGQVNVVLPAACQRSYPYPYSHNPAAPASSSQSSPASSHSPYSLKVSNDLCKMPDGSTGVTCWMQCYTVNDLPCGTNAVCVDTVTGLEVDGTDHCPESNKLACQLECPAQAPSNTTASFDGFCYGSGVSMYMSGFASVSLSMRGTTECVNLLFPDWILDSPWKLLVGCLGTVFFAMLLQVIVRVRTDVLRGRCKTWPLLGAALLDSMPILFRRLLSTFLLACQLCLGYLLMLVTMTYNAELFCSVVVGLVIGHAVFAKDPCGVEGGERHATPASASSEQQGTVERGMKGEVVNAHIVSTLPSSGSVDNNKDAEEPLLDGLSCCGEF